MIRNLIKKRVLFLIILLIVFAVLAAFSNQIKSFFIVNQLICKQCSGTLVNLGKQMKE